MYLKKLENQLVEIVSDIYYDSDGDSTAKADLISAITNIINIAWNYIETENQA